MKSLKQLKPKTMDSNKRNMGSMEKHKLGMGLQSVPVMREPMLQIIRGKNGYSATANEGYFSIHNTQLEAVETFPDTKMLLVSEIPIIFKHKEIMVLRRIELLPNFYSGKQNYEIKSSKAAHEVDNFVPLVLVANTTFVHQNVVFLSEPVIMGKAKDIKKETSVPKRNVVILQGFIEDAAADILEVSSGLAFFLVRTVIDDVVIPLSLKESDSRLSLTGIGSLISWRVQLIEAGLASYRQWDPGKKDLVFNDYCTRRNFGGCCHGALENFSVVAAVSVLMLMSAVFSGNWKRRLWKKLHGRQSSIIRANFFCKLRLDIKSVFQEGGNVRTQLNIDVGQSGQLPRPKIWKVYT